MTAWYNEIEPFAAETLRNLIKAGHIAPGVVDERSIEDVTPAELVGYTQCHFFAGVGVWSLALRRAGWTDDRPVWTGSCPCQPFSAAGKGAGFDDERHLWPAFHFLIEQCRPAAVLGEQVASKDADPWIDLVQADVEALGYAFGAVPFPSAGVGAPHIRDRLYWVAYADGSACGEGRADVRGRADRSDAQPWAGLGGCGLPDRMGNTERAGLALSQRIAGIPGATPGTDEGQTVERTSVHTGGLADHHQHGRAALPIDRRHHAKHYAESCGESSASRPGPTNGLWRAADWLLCRDGKWRPVEPGTFPLVDGAPARVGRLRAYGNAINAEAARVFIEALMESTS